MIKIIQQINNYLKNFIGDNCTISSKDIEQLFKLDGAEVRRSIHKLRTQGDPICSNRNGYFYAKKPNELDRTIQSLNSRILKMQQARNGLVKAKIKFIYPEEGKDAATF